MIEQLRKITGLEIKENEPLKNHTTFRIGGPAKYFIEVNNKKDLKKCLQGAIKINLPFFILGGGSNILAADRGFDGLVIRLSAGHIKITGNKVTAFAGNHLGAVIRTAVAKGLCGLEFAANIPGSIGGAVYGNAGAYGWGVGDFVEGVEVLGIKNKKIFTKKLSKRDCCFDYRESVFKGQKGWLIAAVTLKLIKCEDADEKLKNIEKEYQERIRKQPLQYPCAGSVFKNIIYTDSLTKYKEWESNGKIPAAKFIDEAGLKGMKIGGAMISDKHANFIINTGKAKAKDVMQLINLAKAKVLGEFGINLEEEVRLVGFGEEER